MIVVLGAIVPKVTKENCTLPTIFVGRVCSQIWEAQLQMKMHGKKLEGRSGIRAHNSEIERPSQKSDVTEKCWIHFQREVHRWEQGTLLYIKRTCNIISGVNRALLIILLSYKHKPNHKVCKKLGYGTLYIL